MRRFPRLSAETISRVEGGLFLAPWILGFLLFMAFPILYSFYMSFHQVRVLATGIEVKYRGLENYKFILFTDGSVFYDNLIPFLQQALFMIPIILVFSLLVAIMLNRKFAGRLFFRVVFFLPVIFTTGEVIYEFISQGEGSVGFLERYNIASYIHDIFPGEWASSIMAVMNSIVLVLWYSGVQILLFLAGRQTISNSVYEAARIDGATPWETFWKITLPGMIPFILLNAIYTIVDLFTFPTNPVISRVTTEDYGTSSALAWVYFGVIFLFLLAMYFIFARMTKTYREAA
ncbi:sugar ABC transporter permease [Paenibacillus sp.]|uniref:carbohydrate ABC transporter permease n=1 Tax=Paenibacillus sp. TaxID=58172 RepID=UPI002D5204FC|nr:sugar ABC transporter permease [Paenibacillus sp.]HZG84006.1 sugar ABC transporter permease [Paenibacillus sp.]